jgi:hypothetical protein
MREAAAFLSEIRRLVPPKKGNHALLVQDDGRMAAAIRLPGTTMRFYFEEADMSRGGVELATEVAGMIKQNCGMVA